MSIVSSTGIGSGIDINAIVTQLVSAEGQPKLNSISRQESAVNSRLSGLGTLKSALSEFQTAVNKLKDGNIFKTHKATSSDETLLKVTPGTGAVAGQHTVEITQLATAQKSISASGFTGFSSVVGTGSLTFTSGAGSTFNVTVDSSNQTLEGIRDSINKASGNSFVNASIINVDNGSGGTVSKLVMTARDTGTNGSFTVTGTDSDGLDDSSGLSQLFSTQLSSISTANNAIIKVDGQTATRSKNSITDVLPGITLDLQAAKPGTTINLNVSRDDESIKKAITDFVTAFNKLGSNIKSLGQYGGSTDGSGSGNGSLLGNGTLRQASSQIRQDTTSVISSATSTFNSLGMIGISVDKSGTMSLDSTKLSAALNSNLQSVSEVFSSTDGVAVRLGNRLNQFLQSGGPLDSQQAALKKQLSDLGKSRTRENERLEQVQKTLQKQFTAMDLNVGQFKSTGSFLSNWISKS